MELIINTKEKAILVKDEVNIKELVDKLKEFFGKDWGEWKIKSVVKTEYSYPYPWWYQYWPYDPYKIRWDSGDTYTTKLKQYEIICLT
jgi:hypothetical protein